MDCMPYLREISVFLQFEMNGSIFADMELLRKVVVPGIRMSIKLHQVRRENF